MISDNEKNAKGIAGRLKKWGNDNYSSIDDFANAIGTTKGTLYSSYLNGKHMPGSPMLIKLAKHGCNLNWLLATNEDETTEWAVNEPKAEYNSLEAQNKKLKKETEELKQKLKIAKETINKLLEQ